MVPLPFDGAADRNVRAPMTSQTPSRSVWSAWSLLPLSNRQMPYDSASKLVALQTLRDASTQPASKLGSCSAEILLRLSAPHGDSPNGSQAAKVFERLFRYGSSRLCGLMPFLFGSDSAELGIPQGGTPYLHPSVFAAAPSLLLWTALLLGAPATAAAAVIAEDFASDPLTHGWRVFGDSTLFVWNANNHNLNVTWDSSRPNSYFYLPLGTILNRQDDFSLALDLQLTDVAAGVTKPSTFELAFGFLNLLDATRTNFFRGNAYDSPNLVEFDFFPAAGDISPTLWPSFWSTNSVLNYNGSGDYTLLDLPVGPSMRVTMSYTASNQTLATLVTTNGVSIGAITSVQLNPSFTDFRVGALALESYSDAGQDARYGGSVLAHGMVDNILLSVPPPPVQNIAGKMSDNLWQVTFTSRTNWLYTLERTVDFQSWVAASATAGGNGATLNLQDSSPRQGRSFYRVRAERP